MARTFTAASSHRITASAGGVGSLTALTLVAVVKRTTNATGYGLVLQDAAPAMKAALGFSVNNVQFGTNGGASATGLTVPVTDNWVLVAVSKPAGTATVRARKYVYDTNAWTRVNGGTPADPSSAVDSINIGHLASNNYFNGQIAAAAVFAYALADDQVDNLPFSLSAWHALTPTAMWVLDQADIAQPLVDLTGGGANQTAINGTVVSTFSVPILGYGADSVSVLDSVPWDGELANTGGGQADETAVTTSNSAAGGDPWNAVTVSVGGEVTYDDVNSNTWHRFATSATSGQSRVEWTSASITAPMARIYGGFWFRIPAAALGATNIYLMRARAATVQTTRISVSTGNKLQIRNTSNSAADQGATNIAADTDYFVRYDITVGASAAGTVELYSSTGTLIETIAPTGVNFGTASVDEVGYGVASNISNQSPYLVRGMVSSANAWPAPPSAGPPAATSRTVAAATVTAAAGKTVAASGRVVAAASLAATVARRAQVAGAVVGVPLAVGSASSGIPPRTGRLVGAAGITAVATKVAACTARQTAAPTVRATAARTTRASSTVVAAAPVRAASVRRSPGTGVTLAIGVCAATNSRRSPAAGRALAAATVVGVAAQPGNVRPAVGRLVGAPFARARIRRVVRRPNSGTIPRPNGGTIPRPTSGVVVRP